MATLLHTNIRGEQIGNATISGVHIVDASITPVKTDVYNSPSDGDVFTYKSSTSQFEWNSIGTMVVNEVPTGSINGANTTFVLNDTPVGNTLEVNLNGILQEPGIGNDYTVSTDTITFTTAPITGDIILCSYLMSAGLGGGVYTDHGNLDGLGDDDHSQYIRVDGSRAFTGVVAGVTPSIAAHLATMGYVDTEIGSHTHDAADVISSTFADARIAQSNVTQHEAAIDHNALNNYLIGQHRTIADGNTGVTDLWSASKISSEIASSSGTTDHSDLNNLDYDNSGHTGFLSSTQFTTSSGDITDQIVFTEDVNRNIYGGEDAGLLVTASGGSDNFLSGYKAGTAMTVGYDNICIGEESGAAITTGDYNVTMGYRAGYKVTGGSHNILVGSEAGSNITTAVGEIFIGLRAGQNDASGQYNVGIGYEALRYPVSGWRNIAVGYKAGEGTNGQNFLDSICIGHYSGSSKTTGGLDVLIGSQAGFSLTNANNNIAIGSSAMFYNRTGFGNVAIGYHALYGVTANDQQYNVAIGDSAGSKVETGANNNVMVGYQSGYEITTGAGNVLIGYKAGYSLTTDSNKLYIENSDSATPLIYGEFDNNLIKINGDLLPATSGTRDLGSDALPWKDLYLTGDSIYMDGSKVLYKDGDDLKIEVTGALEPTASITLPNDKKYRGQTVGGSNRKIAFVDTSDHMQFGDSATDQNYYRVADDHIFQTYTGGVATKMHISPVVGVLLHDDVTISAGHDLTISSGTVTIGAAGTLEAGQDSPTGSGVLGYNGYFYATKVYNAVYNDIADFQQVIDKIEYGKCYYDTPDGAKICTERCQMAVIGIASDTYGFGVGRREDENYAPFAIAGWVLAHVDKEYPTGTPLTNNEDGVLTEILLSEKQEFPERIVAIYKKKESDKFWGSYDEIEVNGRSWVKVK